MSTTCSSTPLLLVKDSPYLARFRISSVLNWKKHRLLIAVWWYWCIHPPVNSKRLIHLKPCIMRKIIVSVNVTLDGYMAGPNCELDWHFNSWNDEMARSLTEQLSKADTILLGRVTYK